jgi:hypothetical protein
MGPSFMNFNESREGRITPAGSPVERLSNARRQAPVRSIPPLVRGAPIGWFPVVFATGKVRVDVIDGDGYGEAV